jgi:hypothetical protein
MKAKEMINHLSTLDPEEEICVVWWERPEPEAIGGNLCIEDWGRICQEFDDYIAFAESDLNDWMQQAITDYMETEKE